MTNFIAPMLAKEWQPGLLRAWGSAHVSAKLDGMRMRIFRVDGEFRAFSRPSPGRPNGCEYTDRLGHLFADLPRDFDNYMADVELFTGSWGRTMSFAKTLDMAEEKRRKLKAMVLDFVDLEAVEKYGRDPTPLVERWQVVLDVCRGREVIIPVEARIISDPNELEVFYRECLDAGLEGLVIKDPQSPYLTTRSALWGKLKAQATAEGTVVGFTPGTGRNEARLGTCVLDYGGKKVECSGYTDHERDMIWQNREVFRGLSLEFKYQPDPAIKARFLVFRRFRWDQTDVLPPPGYKGR